MTTNNDSVVYKSKDELPVGLKYPAIYLSLNYIPQGKRKPRRIDFSNVSKEMVLEEVKEFLRRAGGKFTSIFEGRFAYWAPCTIRCVDMDGCRIYMQCKEFGTSVSLATQEELGLV